MRWSVLRTATLYISLITFLLNMNTTSGFNGRDSLLLKSRRAVGDDGLAEVGGWTPTSSGSGYPMTNHYQVVIPFPIDEDCC